jgi:TATA-binding protein-associated factor Taf7
MDAGAAMGGTGLFISIAGVIYSAVNHKQIKSRCCGKEYDMSIDIGATKEGKEEAAKNGDKKEEKEENEEKEEHKAHKEHKEHKEKTEIVDKDDGLFSYKSKISRIAPHFNI